MGDAQEQVHDNHLSLHFVERQGHAELCQLRTMSYCSAVETPFLFNLCEIRTMIQLRCRFLRYKYQSWYAKKLVLNMIKHLVWSVLKLGWCFLALSSLPLSQSLSSHISLSFNTDCHVSYGRTGWHLLISVPCSLKIGSNIPPSWTAGLIGQPLHIWPRNEASKNLFFINEHPLSSLMCQLEKVFNFLYMI